MDNLITAFRNALSNYATFSGRESRPGFWWYILAYLILMVIAGILESVLFAPMMGMGNGGGGSGPLTGLLSLALLLPNLAIGARRLHDGGRSGWWLLIGLVPIVGFLVLIYFYIQPSDPGDNAYGPKPSWPPAG